MVATVWSGFSSRLRKTPSYVKLRETVDITDGSAVLSRLPLPAAAWILELLRQDLERPVVAVVSRESEAVAWLEAARLFGEPEDAEAVTYLPSPALTPYQEAQASLMVRAGEAMALDRILSTEQPGIVCTPRALFQRLPLPDDFRESVLDICQDEDHPIEQLISSLDRMGYRRSDLVADIGTYAVRGGVFDLFPPGEESPLRFDLFGDTVESIKRFDPATQRSSEALTNVRVRPLALFPCGEGEAMTLAEELDLLLGDEASPEALTRIESLAAGTTFSGWENYLPLAFDTKSTLELLDDPIMVFVDPDTIAAETKHHRELLSSEYQSRVDQKRLAIPPELLVAPEEHVEDRFIEQSIRVGNIIQDQGLFEPRRSDLEIDFNGSLTERLQSQLPRFPREVETARARGERLMLIAPQSNHQRLRDYLEGAGPDMRPDLNGDVDLVAGELSRGFRLPDLELNIYGEEQLFARRVHSTPKSRFGPFLSGLRDLKVGEYIVHEDHGIGQFIGMRALGEETASGPSDLPPVLGDLELPSSVAVEVMEIVYAKDRTLLMPLSRIHQIQKYSGIEGVAPRLDRLGGSSWTNKKSKVKRGLKKLATDLLKLYAERELAKAPQMPPDSDAQVQFESAFEHDETDDQLEASRVIKEDLQKRTPMDRLLCGDVGFGKTEVSMRAAFKAVDAGYQVAVLAPTTILADQHLRTFRRRFDGFPIEIEMISRFRTPAEVKEIRAKVAEGKIDILIGTHRLLGPDVVVPNLGLLVVDEEQRFGVGQKEKLKELKKDVHVLAMSATPVPRTLQLSLAGVRDLSVIETPPKDRMAIDTQILPFSGELIREAIEFELERGGQVYFVYNRVEGIEEMTRYLKQLVPSVRVTVGHGQMDEKELSSRMRSFTAGEQDVLIATTIIENGIDIPNVNTMIVHRADRFGLAQLYQLRGRVGRSDQLAFCYLLVASDQALTGVARKRLEAIREFTDLGAGFRIAARDLEIRGAGNLLGAEQSGHIAELGIEAYLKMLEDTVRELKGEEAVEAPSADIDLPVPMAIPQEYISDTSLRMEIYRRIASGDEPVDEIVAELRDRFGPPPENVTTLIKVASLKRMAEELRVQSISAKGRSLVIRLRQNARVDVDTLIRFVSERGEATFSPSGVLTINGVPPAETLAVARQTLEMLAPSVFSGTGAESPSFPVPTLSAGNEELPS